MLDKKLLVQNIFEMIRFSINDRPCRMEKTLLVLVALWSGITYYAQVHVYPKDDIFYHEMLLNVENGYVCPGNFRNWSEALVTVSNEQIFEGFSNSPFNLLYTFKDNKLLVGDSQFSSDVMFTFKDGKIYKGNSDYLLDQLFTYDRGRLYKGAVISVFDIVITIEGTPTIAELFAIMLVLELI